MGSQGHRQEKRAEFLYRPLVPQHVAFIALTPLNSFRVSDTNDTTHDLPATPQARPAPDLLLVRFKQWPPLQEVPHLQPRPPHHDGNMRLRTLHEF